MPENWGDFFEQGEHVAREGEKKSLEKPQNELIEKIEYFNDLLKDPPNA